MTEYKMYICIIPQKILKMSTVRLIQKPPSGRGNAPNLLRKPYLNLVRYAPRAQHTIGFP